MRAASAAALAVAVALALAGCSGSAPQRPDPLPIVTSYLSALAEGDSATASALDAAAFEDAPFLEGDGTGMLATGALAAASERIVVGGVKLLSTDDESAAVEADFSLDGQAYNPKLRLVWNTDGETWVLIDSLANLFDVRALTPEGVAGPAPFTLAGFAPTGSFDGVDAPVTYVYPGVYPLSVKLDPSLLADPSAPLDSEVVIPPYYQGSQGAGVPSRVDFVLR